MRIMRMTMPIVLRRPTSLMLLRRLCLLSYCDDVYAFVNGDMMHIVNIIMTSRILLCRVRLPFTLLCRLYV